MKNAPSTTRLVMNETTIALLTVLLGELFLVCLVLISTLIIYFRFVQPTEMTIDLDSIEMSTLQDKPTMPQTEL